MAVALQSGLREPEPLVEPLGELDSEAVAQAL